MYNDIMIMCDKLSIVLIEFASGHNKSSSNNQFHSQYYPSCAIMYLSSTTSHCIGSLA